MYLKSYIEKYQLNGFDFNEAKTEVEFALEILFNYKYKDFLLNKELDDWQIKKLQEVIDERVKSRRPIQQILGQSFFYGRRFFVNECTLIPRPETELLVREVLDNITKTNNIKILDIGTGTGCIGLTLMLENNKINSDMIDIQLGALDIAKKNALFHNISDGAKFIKSDLFENIKEKYDVIVSNPPYIPLKDKENLQTEVKDYDPELALFTNDEDGIEFYEKIIQKSGEYLKEQGLLAFELGINQSKKVAFLLKKNGFIQINTTKDYNGIERIITAKK